MNRLFEHLRAKNAAGIQHSEAVQLFLWIYSSKEVLPPSLQTEVLSKEVLVGTFERLSRDGFVVGGVAEESAQGYLAVPWADLAQALLAGRVELDSDFPSRASRYF